MLFNLASSQKFIYKTDVSLGAMKGKTRPCASLMLSFVTPSGTLASAHMFCMPFPSRYRIIVLFFLPVITVPEGRVFKFENFWARIPGFDEVVKRAWDKPTSHIEPWHVLHHNN
jgi:hypothetical protein